MDEGDPGRQHQSRIAIHSPSANIVAQCLLWVKSGKAQIEHMFSGLPPTPDVLRHRSEPSLRAISGLMHRTKVEETVTAAFLSFPIPGIICLVCRSLRNSRPTTCWTRPTNGCVGPRQDVHRQDRARIRFPWLPFQSARDGNEDDCKLH